MSKFILLPNRDKLCPKCGSISRNRRLWSLLENQIQGKTILHFSPSKSIRKKLEEVKGLTYVSSDFAGEFEAMKKLNIEAIDEPNETYDLVICYHVLEHIENDFKAMKDLYRILKSNGICIIQTPFKDGETYENDAIKTEQERLLHFGQKDHVRIYSIEGLRQRLESTGFEISVRKFEELESNPHGFSIKETVIMAEKSRGQALIQPK